MAKTQYGRFLLNSSHCYVISNTNADNAEDVSENSLTNPPIKMVVESLEDSWDLTFDADSNPMNDSRLTENLAAVLRGETPEFRLVGVNVSDGDGIYLVYDSMLPPEEYYDGTTGYSGGQVCVYGKFTILFEVAYLDGSPVKQYRIESKATGKNHDKLRITEYVGGHKSRKLEFCDSPTGTPYLHNGNSVYCIITEY